MTMMMTRRCAVWGLLGTLTMVAALAQQPAQDFATLREKADRLARDVRRAQQEVTFSEDAMLRLDTKIEERISALVDLIAKSKDSPATDERVAACRAAAVTGLQRTLALYVAEREQRRRNGWDTSRLDQRIDLRLQQMAKIADSYAPGEAPGKGTTFLEDTEIEEAFRGLKAGKYLGDLIQTREDMIKELEKTVEHLTALRDTTTLQASITADPAQKEKLDKQIAYLDDLVEKRRGQLQELLSAPQTTEAAPIGVGKVSELERDMRAARKELRAQFMDLQRLATTRDYQQKRADVLATELAQVKAAMDRAANQK
jgi:hypothetical protein